MENDTTWLWLLGLVAVGAVVFLLLGATPEVPPAEPVSQIPTTSAVGEPPSSAKAALPPSVEAGRDLTLDERESVRLAGEGSDVAGGAVTYYWTAAGGRGYFDDSSAPTPIYTAPSICGCEECIALTLVAANDRGQSATDHLFVRVRGDPLACSSPLEAPCFPAKRPCGAPCERPAPPPCGPVPCGCEPPCPAVTPPCAPPVHPCDRPCVQEVKVPEPCAPMAVPVPCGPCAQAPVDPWPCDRPPCERAWDVPWYIVPPEPSSPGSLPTPLIARHYAKTVEEGGTVPLRGAIAGPGCEVAYFRWTADKGWFENPESLDPTWHAPLVDSLGGEEACITLSIADSRGGRGYDQIRIHVVNVRRPK